MVNITEPNFKLAYLWQTINSIISLLIKAGTRTLSELATSIRHFNWYARFANAHFANFYKLFIQKIVTFFLDFWTKKWSLLKDCFFSINFLLHQFLFNFCSFYQKTENFEKVKFDPDAQCPFAKCPLHIKSIRNSAQKFKRSS